MKKLTQREKIRQFKDTIINSDYEKYEQNHPRSEKLLGTMYLKEKMDYGFHVYFIHEPSDRDPLAGKYGTVSEMFYDLRNRKHWIKRNMKDVQFSVRNVDSIFPKYISDQQKVFSWLSTKGNRGLYDKAFARLGAIGEEKTEMFGRFFHRLITDFSHYELLHKAGVDISKRITVINRDGKSPREIMGLSKTQWKLVSQYGCRHDSFDNRTNANADRKAIEYLSYIKTLEDEFGLGKIDTFTSHEFNHIYGEGAYRSALEIAENYDLPINKFIKYIYFECDVSQGLNASTAISQYEDYIRMTTEMGYENFDRYPKTLRMAHDIAARNYQIVLNEQELEEWNDAYEQHSQYTYSYKDYTIFPPKEPSDLVREGNMLNHCVSSYINKVRKQVSSVLFLRLKEDEERPLVTIEVKDNRIIQARGKMNDPPNAEQKDIIKKFAEKYELAM